MPGALTTSCILAEPPPYQQPEQTAPWLDLVRADPSVNEVVQLSKVSTPSSTQHLQISVPVRSEDAGETLTFALIINWNTAEEIRPTSGMGWKGTVKASTLDDVDREISTLWNYSGVGIPSGCNHLTLIVTHSSNYDHFRDVPNDWADVALATWILNVEDDPPGTNTLSDCPSSLGGEP